jgi:hypothetical protein
MDQLITHPAVQAALAPFVAALVVAVALRHTQLLGLAVVFAFAAAVGLTMGYSFETFTAARKLEVIGFSTAILVMGLAAAGAKRTRRARLALDLAVAATVPWLLWRVLQQQELSSAVLKGLASAAFAGLLLDAALRHGEDRIGSAMTAMMLGLTAGSLAVLGASVVLGQLAIAVAAGGGAVLLVLLTAKTSQAPWSFILPASVICGLASLLAVFTGSLPWFCLLPVLAIPWATGLVPQDLDRRWRTALLTLLASLLPAALAIGTAWFASPSVI